MSQLTVVVSEKEWERVKAYIDCAEIKRKEEKPSLTLIKQLDDEVNATRNTDEWNQFVNKYDLQIADVDILIFAIAPVASPIIGWLYREHQAGDISGQPGIDLICELLSLKSSEVTAYRNRLTRTAPLIKHGLIVLEHAMPFAPLRPTQRARSQLLGLVPDGTEIPGATLVESLPSLEEVICPQILKEQLQQIASWPSHDSQLVNWDIRVEHGPVALLSGPSGTGKTLAATALAKEAKLTLYRVDLGLLVSKYVGETEKNLNAMFDRAAEMDCVLLFDEADSLFGKRGQVKDAKDRYANMEVGHLLSRLERHRGMCLLTSNLREQIDPAFLRRIDVVLHFNLPTEEERRLLWQKYMGSMVDYVNTIRKDDEKLTDHEELINNLAIAPRFTGAQIANACRYTGRLLAVESTQNNKVQSQNTLLNKIALSVHNELNKDGTETLRSSLGFLWEHLNGVQR